MTGHDDQKYYEPYPRDMVGYGAQPPRVEWPGSARLAVQFVINYEEGGENCVLHDDSHAETFLSEIIDAPAHPDRHMSVESIYEYGSRTGFWRLHSLFSRFRVPVTVYGVAMAMERNPEAVEEMLREEWEIASHGYRWIDYQYVSKETERAHLHKAIEIQRRLTGSRPLGWYTGRNSPNTRDLIIEEGGFLYDSDSYADDLPYWHNVNQSSPHLIIPYTLDANDMRFLTPHGFSSGSQFFEYLKDTFDALYDEGIKAPKMMSIGLHCRIAGRPGRFRALERFLNYVLNHEDVWLCRRVDIARHWYKHHFPIDSPSQWR